MRENIFYALNPWRIGNEIPLPSNSVMRDTTVLLFTSNDTRKIRALIGTRRAGKTTIFLQLLSLLIKKKKVSPQNIFYFTFDDIDLRREVGGSSGTMIDIIEKFSGMSIEKLEGEIYVFIDEIQKSPSFFDTLKLYYDIYHSKMKFFISGSSSLELFAQVSETLAGRIEYIKVEPFSQKEILQKRIKDFRYLSLLNSIMTGSYEKEFALSHQAKCLPYLSEIKNIFETGMLWGYIPEVYLARSNSERLNFLRNYRMTYLEKDIRELTRIGSVENYSKVLDIITLQVANILDISHISRETGLSVNTVKKYIEVLKKTFVLREIPSYVSSLRKRLIKRPKIYLFDNGPYTFLSQLNSLEQLKTTGRIGNLFENYCLNEISKNVSYLPMLPRIHFWQTSTGLEVDFVIEYGTHIIPVEVKYKRALSNRDVKNLYKFMESCEGKIDKAVVIYTGEFKERENIIYLPVWMI